MAEQGYINRGDYGREVVIGRLYCCYQTLLHCRIFYHDAFFTLHGSPSTIPSKAWRLTKATLEPPHNVYYQSQQKAEQYHCGYGKVQFKVLSFNPDIAWKTAKPFDGIWKQIDNKADGNNCDTEENDVLPCL